MKGYRLVALVHDTGDVLRTKETWPTEQEAETVRRQLVAVAGPTATIEVVPA